MNQKQQLIGLVGTNGSGKSTVCQILKRKQFVSISLSDYVRDILDEKGLPQTRDNLVTAANDLKQEKGQHILAQFAYLQFSRLDVSCVVFDSIRNLEEINFLKQKRNND